MGNRTHANKTGINKFFHCQYLFINIFMEFITLWPNNIASNQFDGDLSDLKNKILTESYQYPESTDTTSINGYQPEWPIQPWSWEDTSWQPVKSFIQKAFDEYALRSYGPDVRADVIRSWTVIYDENGYQKPHCHQSVDVSSAFCVDITSPGGELVLTNPSVQSSYSNFQPWSQTLPLKTGQLILFPPWVMHYTQPVFTKQGKIVISVDARFRQVD